MGGFLGFVGGGGPFSLWFILGNSSSIIQLTDSFFCHFHSVIEPTLYIWLLVGVFFPVLKFPFSCFLYILFLSWHFLHVAPFLVLQLKEDAFVGLPFFFIYAGFLLSLYPCLVYMEKYENLGNSSPCPWVLRPPGWFAFSLNLQSLCIFIGVQHQEFQVVFSERKRENYFCSNFTEVQSTFFNANINLKISLNLDFQRMNLRGLLLICFWIISTFQISGMKEYLDKDANRITEHSVSAKVQGSRGGALSPLNQCFLLPWETVIACYSKVWNSPHFT